jgi:hypothetical protein
LEELLGLHRLPKTAKDYNLVFGENRIEINGVGPSLIYRRYKGSELASEAMMVSDEDPVAVGVFPIAPLFTPQPVASNLYIKFKTPVLVDPESQAVVYAKMPIEIGVFRQSKNEEKMIDAFSRTRQQYALYGSPESGVVCRYTESEVSASGDEIKPAKYEEALVRVRITNEINNVIRVGRVIIPLDGVILDHAHDDAWLPGSVEMELNSSFGKDIVNVRLAGTKIKKTDKTSTAKKEETLIFLMDAGY